MTESAWAALVAEPGAQARHQAAEILRRPLDEFEAHLEESIRLRRWAVAVLAGKDLRAEILISADRGQLNDWRAAQLEAIAWIASRQPPRPC